MTNVDDLVREAAASLRPPDGPIPPFRSVQQRAIHRRLLGLTIVAVAVVAGGTLVLTARHGSGRVEVSTRGASSSSTSTGSSTPSSTTLAPTTTVSVTTAPARPSVQELLSALRSDRFDGSGLPPHLHVVGVGPWQYADAGHVGSGYLGSAEVSLRSDAPGETISDNYDVFTTRAAASASLADAYSNFRAYGPAGGVRVPQLNPPVDAFCGQQAGPANTTTCWFVHGATTAIVTATIPAAADAGDSQALLQAMLTHLLSLGG